MLGVRHRASGWQPPYLLPDPSHNRPSHPLPESSCGPCALQDLLLDQQPQSSDTTPRGLWPSLSWDAP